MAEFDSNRDSGRARRGNRNYDVRDKIWRKLESDHSKFAGFAQRHHRSPEYLERHIMISRDGLASWRCLRCSAGSMSRISFGSRRYFRRMVGHERERLDIEKDSLRCALRHECMPAVGQSSSSYYKSVFKICAAAERNDPGHEDWQIVMGLPNTPGRPSFSSWTAALTKPP
jgi:hypothetical protein